MSEEIKIDIDPNSEESRRSAEFVSRLSVEELRKLLDDARSSLVIHESDESPYLAKIKDLERQIEQERKAQKIYTDFAKESIKRYEDELRKRGQL